MIKINRNMEKMQKIIKKSYSIKVIVEYKIIMK